MAHFLPWLHLKPVRLRQFQRLLPNWMWKWNALPEFTSLPSGHCRRLKLMSMVADRLGFRPRSQVSQLQKFLRRRQAFPLFLQRLNPQFRNLLFWDLHWNLMGRGMDGFENRPSAMYGQSFRQVSRFPLFMPWSRLLHQWLPGKW